MSVEKDLPLRQRLGLTQQHYAEYLRVSRSMLATHETKGAMLPAAAREKEAKLETMLQQQLKQTKKLKPAHEKPQAEKAIKQLDTLSKKTDRKINITKRQLENIQKLYARHTRTYQLLQTLQSQIDNDKHDTLWLPMMLNVTEENIDKVGLHKQYKLMLQLASLQHLVTTIQQQMDELKKI